MHAGREGAGRGGTHRWRGDKVKTEHTGRVMLTAMEQGEGGCGGGLLVSRLTNEDGEVEEPAVDVGCCRVRGGDVAYGVAGDGSEEGSRVGGEDEVVVLW